jgi:predicted PurR-regulated permease PerM
MKRRKPSLAFSGGLNHPLMWTGVIAGTLISLVLCDLIWWLSVPCVLSIAVYYICKPLVRMLQRNGLSHGHALIVFLMLATLLAIPALLLLIPLVAGFIYSLVDQVPMYAASLERVFNDSLSWLEESYPSFEEEHVGEQVRQKLEQSRLMLMEQFLPKAAIGLITSIPSLLLVPYLSFFFLKDGAKFKRLIMRGVPNAFFEKILLLFDQMDRQVRMYFRGLMGMTFLDTVTLGLGLWVIGLIFGDGLFPFGQAMTLGFICAVLSWVPYLGTFLGCLLILVITLAFPEMGPLLQVVTVLLFIAVRTVDDFLYTPMTVGRSLQAHPLVTVLVIFVGGFLGGVTGLLLAMPLLGIWMVLGEIFGRVWQDGRLRARHEMARALRQQSARRGLTP